MQIHQILIRPSDNILIIAYRDLVGRQYNLSLQVSDIATAADVVSQCQQRLPADEEHPAKEQVEQEISELEYRLEQLRQSIGVA